VDKKLLDTLQDILKKAEKKIPYAAATFFSNRGIEIDIDKKDEHLSAGKNKLGFVFSVFNGEYFEEFATDIIEDDHLVAFCQNAIENIRPKKVRYKIAAGNQGFRSYETATKIDPDHISINEKIDMLRHQRAAIFKGKNVVNCQIAYAEELKDKIFVSSQGVTEEKVRNISHYLMVYVSEDNSLKYDYLSRGGTGGMELVQIEDDQISELIENANRLLHAERIEPNFYDVVATPEIAGLIAHEAFGHGVETDMYLKDRARSKEFLNKIIASPIVSIIDDPTLPGGYGSYFIDDEGVDARPTYIIREGRFVKGLTNLYSSAVLNLPQTANGRRESFMRKVYTRMSNTFFKSGTSDPHEMIKSIDNGVYLVKGLSGMEDPKGWGIQVLVLYGEEIRHGELTGRIFSPLGITGFVPDLLKNISMVGNDFRVDLGLCGKGYKEYIPVSSGGPHIRTRVRLG
jgi:TldD protein